MPVDPYRTLGVTREVSDQELRRAYRRLVQRHHPDHNGGSADAARRFEEVQSAYARIREERATTPGDLDDRLAALEFELREAQRERERRLREERRRRAQRAAGGDLRRHATDEELGYVTTEDSLGAILRDARAELGERFSQAGEHPVVRRVSDLIDGLEGLASGLDRVGSDRRRDPRRAE